MINKAGIDERELHNDNPTANILNGEKLKAFSLGIRQRCSLSWFVFNIILDILAPVVRQEKEKKKGSKMERKKEKCHYF